MSILNQIDQDLIKALKAGEKLRATVLRGLKSDIKYAQIDKGDDFGDEDIMAVLTSCAKKRRESIEQFQNGNRQDLADKEQAELGIIETYLPKQLSGDELRSLVTEAIAECGASSPKDIGLVMKAVMPKVKGKADGKQVNQLASEILAK
jgi:uncharacterized protein YqeY